MNESLVVLQATILLSAPLVLASMGGLASERSGIINIALEGKMLAACVLTALCSMASGNPLIGLAAGIGGSIALSCLHVVFTQTFRIDHIVSGMAINALAYGASNVIDRRWISTADSTRFASLPQWLYLAVAFASPVALWWYLSHTRGGLRLRAVGEDPEKARLVGLDVQRIRWVALIATGALCGLAGAMLVSSAGSFVDRMTAGRGFIALAALILGGWRPLPALISCLVFGFFDALQIQLQGTAVAGAKLPPEFWKALPYVATLFALLGLLGRNRAPAGLGRH